MANQYVNKVVINGATKIDLTGDTVTANDLLTGKTAHDRSGAQINGACTFDADTSDANALPAELLIGKTAYVAGQKITGTMPNRAGASGTLASKDDEYTIQQGYHDGSGKVGINSTEKAKIIAGNIKAGVQLLGVTGTYSGETINVQARSTTPSFIQQTILPETGYDYLSQVTVAPIPVTETDNPQGGVTVTVG